MHIGQYDELQGPDARFLLLGPPLRRECFGQRQLRRSQQSKDGRGPPNRLLNHRVGMATTRRACSTGTRSTGWRSMRRTGSALMRMASRLSPARRIETGAGRQSSHKFSHRSCERHDDTSEREAVPTPFTGKFRCIARAGIQLQCRGHFRIGRGLSPA